MTHYSNKPMRAKNEMMTHLIIILVTHPLHQILLKTQFIKNCVFNFFLLIQNKFTERMVTVNTGTTELDFGVEVISRQSPSLFLLYTTVDASTLICHPLYNI